MVIDSWPRSAGAPPARPRHRPRVAATASALLATSVVCGALAVALAQRAFSLVSDSPVLTIDACVELVVTGVGALVACWLAGSTLLALGCLAVRLVGSSWRLGERLVHRCAPAIVRRALVVVVSASVGLGVASGASAGTPAPTPSPTSVSADVSMSADDLGWAITTPAAADVSPITDTPPPAPSTEPAPVVEPTPHPPAASAAAPATAPAAPATTTPSPDPRRVVVVAGDTLWAIAARHLGPDATDAEIAASWPRWFHANSAVIGADPGLIRPGQVLTAPDAQGEATS